MKRLTKQQLRELHIFNPHNLCRSVGNKLYIGYTAASYGRVSQSAAWQIVGIGFKTEPNGAWYNHGHKTFNVWSREDKQPQLELAMQWVKDNYGFDSFERDVFGSYQLEGTQEKTISLYLKGT